MPLGLPPWAEDLHGLQFRRLVLDGPDLYLVAIDQRHIEGVGLLTVITSLPVDSALMDVVAEKLGRVGLYGLMTGGPQANPVSSACLHTPALQTTAPAPWTTICNSPSYLAARSPRPSTSATSRSRFSPPWRFATGRQASG